MKNSKARNAILTSQRTSFSWPFTQKARTGSKWVFYPGCALSAANPQMIVNVLDHLKKLEPSTSLLYGCCGKPSQAAGLDDMFNENLNKLSKDLDSAGIEKLITACPNCQDVFKKQLDSKVEVVFLWSHLMASDHEDALEFENTYVHAELADQNGLAMRGLLHDACVMKDHPEEMQEIRAFLGCMGIEVDDFPGQGAPVCCGKKNMLHMTNPDAYMTLANRRVLQSEGQLILTYCQSCAHSFESAQGKSLSLMELFFGGGKSQRPSNGLLYWKNRLVNAIKG